MVFTNLILHNYCLDTFVGDFIIDPSPHAETNTQFELHYTKIVEPNYNIFWLGDTKIDVSINFLTLYFDGSKSKEGAGVGCILIYPQGNKKLIPCKLEFKCTNNTVEYEYMI